MSQQNDKCYIERENVTFRNIGETRVGCPVAVVCPRLIRARLLIIRDTELGRFEEQTRLASPAQFAIGLDGDIRALQQGLQHLC